MVWTFYTNKLFAINTSIHPSIQAIVNRSLASKSKIKQRDLYIILLYGRHFSKFFVCLYSKTKADQPKKNIKLYFIFSNLCWWWWCLIWIFFFIYFTWNKIDLICLVKHQYKKDQDLKYMLYSCCVT